MSYQEESKVDKALNVLGMYSSFDEIRVNLGLSKHEFDELKERAKRRYGDDIFI